MGENIPTKGYESYVILTHLIFQKSLEMAPVSMSFVFEWFLIFEPNNSKWTPIWWGRDCRNAKRPNLNPPDV